MAGFTKEIKDFFGDIGGFDQKLLSPIPPSQSRMTPGNVLVLDYPEDGKRALVQRVVLLVRIKRGHGIFISSQNNLLVACFQLNAKSATVVEIIMENLYKKRRRSSYYGKIKESLVSLLGIDSFKTFNLNKMRSIYQVYLGKDLPKAR